MEKEENKIEQLEEITHEQLVLEIRERANQIFLERGDNPGSELDDWLQAEKEIKSKYKMP